MTRRYDFKASNGATVIPVANGQFFTDEMSVTPDQVDIYIAFFSDSNRTPVTPTAGTITANGEYFPGFFLQATNPVIQANTVITPNATYTPPTIDGCSLRARIDLAGVTGATHFSAFAYKRS